MNQEAEKRALKCVRLLMVVVTGALKLLFYKLKKGNNCNGLNLYSHGFIKICRKCHYNCMAGKVTNNFIKNYLTKFILKSQTNAHTKICQIRLLSWYSFISAFWKVMTLHLFHDDKIWLEGRWKCFILKISH